MYLHASDLDPVDDHPLVPPSRASPVDQTEEVRSRPKLVWCSSTPGFSGSVSINPQAPPAMPNWRARGLDCVQDERESTNQLDSAKYPSQTILRRRQIPSSTRPGVSRAIPNNKWGDCVWATTPKLEHFSRSPWPVARKGRSVAGSPKILESDAFTWGKWQE